MTIPTISSFDGKLVEVSLISDEFRHGQTQPPPPYQPKLLETEDGGATNDNDDESDMCNDKYVMQRLVDLFDTTAFAIWKSVMLLLLFAIFGNQQNIHYYKGMQLKLQDTEDNSEMVLTCYPSNVFAEIDTLLLPDSPPPSSKNVNPEEEVIRKSALITIKSARFMLLIDFIVNITGIVDYDNQRCYVMQLLHNSDDPHESLCYTLFELSPGYYSLDNINNTLSYFYMVKPAVTNLYGYGMFIPEHCTNYPTFKMERDIATDSP